jgi:hypothetical protein
LSRATVAPGATKIHRKTRDRGNCGKGCAFRNQSITIAHLFGIDGTAQAACFLTP